MSTLAATATRAGEKRADLRFPAGLLVGRGDRRLPDRGRRDRGRPDPVDLGHLLRHPRQGRQRRHRSERDRPLPPLPRRRRAHGRASAWRRTGSRSPGPASAPRGGRRQPGRAGLLRPARRRAARRRHQAGRHALPLGPAAGARGRGRLDQPRHRLPVRRLRRGGRRSASATGSRCGTRSTSPGARRSSATAPACTPPGAPTTPTRWPPPTTCCSRTAWPCRRCARRRPARRSPSRSTPASCGRSPTTRPTWTRPGASTACSTGSSSTRCCAARTRRTSMADTAAVTDWSFVRDGDLDLIGAPIDALGVNYYQPDLVSAANGRRAPTGHARTRPASTCGIHPTPGPRTDMGWPVDPTGPARGAAAASSATTATSRSTSPRTAPPTPTASTPTATSTTRSASTTCTATWPRRTRRSRPASTCAATSSGRCWTTSSGRYGYGKRFGIVHVDYATQVAHAQGQRPLVPRRHRRRRRRSSLRPTLSRGNGGPPKCVHPPGCWHRWWRRRWSRPSRRAAPTPATAAAPAAARSSSRSRRSASSATTTSTRSTWPPTRTSRSSSGSPRPRITTRTSPRTWRPTPARPTSRRSRRAGSASSPRSPAKFYDFMDYGGAEIKSQWPDVEVAAAAPRPDGKVIGLGTDVGGMAMCYRTRPVREGRPADRPRRGVGSCGRPGRQYIETGKKFKAAKVPGTAFFDGPTVIYRSILGQAAGRHLRRRQGRRGHQPRREEGLGPDRSRRSTPGLSAKIAAWSPDWNAGFAKGTFATLACPSWMMAYIQEQAKDSAGQVGHRGGSRRRRQLGRLVPDACPSRASTRRRRPTLAKWLTAPEQQAKVFRAAGQLPVDGRRCTRTR